MSRQFARIVERAGLPPIRLHDLRHGAATLALAGGADLKIVQQMLRHSTITLTADTYTSVLPQVARQAAENAAALIPRAATENSTTFIPGAAQSITKSITEEPSARTLHAHEDRTGVGSSAIPENVQVRTGAPPGT